MEIRGIHNEVIIGRFRSHRVVESVISARRHHPLSRATIRLADPAGELARESLLDAPVTITYGHRGGALSSWSGTVSATTTGNRDQIEIDCVGVERPLATTRITQSWRNEAPEAIITYAAEQAGMDMGMIAAPGPTFPHFVSSHSTPWEIAKSCARTCEQQFGINMQNWAFWVDSEGRVNWGDFAGEQVDVPVVATGAGLIRHDPDSGQWFENRVETFLLPGFWHSERFHLKDDRRGVDNEFRALAVEHRISGKRARTTIHMGEEYGRF
ncbi:MAG: hypothetical protein HQL72_09065 [Magnetococcales bacterium]|nr:hypothetical protein [Magnetococcales bacterium]